MMRVREALLITADAFTFDDISYAPATRCAMAPMLMRVFTPLRHADAKRRSMSI